MRVSYLSLLDEGIACASLLVSWDAMRRDFDMVESQLKEWMKRRRGLSVEESIPPDLLMFQFDSVP